MITNYVLIILGSLFSAFIAIFIKKYINNYNFKWLIFSIIFSLFLICIYVNLFKSKKMSITYPLIKIISVLMVFLFGVFYFREKPTYREIIGLIFGIISIYLLCDYDLK